MNSPYGSFRKAILLSVVVLSAAITLGFFGCSSGGGNSTDTNNDNVSDENGDGGGLTTSADYVVLAWNDLGMHCLNPTYDQLIMLPPYNTLWAQVIKRGNPPKF